MMSDLTYNNQMFTQYLLGALSEAESERLDGLSITDGQFNEALQAVEKDLVDAYVQGELAGDDLARFQSYYLASPLRSANVEFARAFRGWAEANSLKGVRVPTQAEEVARRSGSNWLGVFGFPRSAWRWGFAGIALTLLLAAGLLLFQNVRLRQQMAEARVSRDELLQREQQLQTKIEAQRVISSQTEQELARVRDEREHLEQELKRRTQPSGEGTVVSLILMPPLRGSGQVPTLSLKPGANRVAAQLQIEAADYSAYRVSLIDPVANETLWRSGRLNAGLRSSGKALSVSFPSSLLKPQTYILQVSGVAANNEAEVMSDYPFKVVK